MMRFVLANLRMLIAETDPSVVAEYTREISEVMSKTLMNEITNPMRDVAKNLPAAPEQAAALMESAKEIDAKAKTYAWAGALLGYIKKYPSVRYDDALSDFYLWIVNGSGNDKPLTETLTEAIKRKFPGFWNGKSVPTLDDIQRYWFHFSRGIVSEISRDIKKRKLIVDSDSEQHELENTKRILPAPTVETYDEDIVTEDEIGDALSSLVSFVVGKAHNPEDAKLFKYLIKAVVANDSFTNIGTNKIPIAGRKKFVGIMKHLAHDAPNRDNENFWRSVWDKMRIHVCQFFKNIFQAQGVRMTETQKKVVCSSEVVDMLAKRLVAAEIRTSLARYVLGMNGIRGDLLSGTYLSPKAMVDQLREERKKQATVNRVARSFIMKQDFTALHSRR
jgi:hypothetical protein